MWEWAMAYPILTAIIILIVCHMITTSVGYITSKNDKRTIEDEACPHGYTDWDDCPECGH